MAFGQTCSASHSCAFLCRSHAADMMMTRRCHVLWLPSRWLNHNASRCYRFLEFYVDSTMAALAVKPAASLSARHGGARNRLAARRHQCHARLCAFAASRAGALVHRQSSHLQTVACCIGCLDAAGAESLPRLTSVLHRDGYNRQTKSCKLAHANRGILARTGTRAPPFEARHNTLMPIHDFFQPNCDHADI